MRAHQSIPNWPFSQWTAYALIFASGVGCSANRAVGDGRQQFAESRALAPTQLQPDGGAEDKVSRKPLRQLDDVSWEHVLRSPDARTYGLVEFRVRDSNSGNVELVCAVADMALLLIIRELGLGGEEAGKIGLEALRARATRTIELPGGLPQEFREWLPPEADRTEAQKHIDSYTDASLLEHEAQIYQSPHCATPVKLIACGCAMSRRGLLVSLRKEPAGLIVERKGR